jgi:hypothetical protein
MSHDYLLTIPNTLCAVEGAVEGAVGSAVGSTVGDAVECASRSYMNNILTS